MMTDQMREKLQKRGAFVRNSHVVYTSRRHGSDYFNKDAIYPDTRLISQICCEIANEFRYDKVDVVVGPQVGGIIVSQWVAHHLTYMDDDKREILSVYAEKSDTGTGFVLRRGYDALVRHKRVLVVEDVLTTGGTVKKVIDLVRSVHGKVVGIGAICNRGGIRPRDLRVRTKLVSYLDLTLSSWTERSCPLCKQGIPINTDVGKGREFLSMSKK